MPPYRWLDNQAESGAGLKRSSLKRTRKKVQREFDHDARRAWKQAAAKRPCVVCGSRDQVEGHHILYQQWLREAGLKFGLDQESLLWDQRNLLPLCYRHHSRHHSAVERVPMSILPPQVFEMARELFIDWRLERTYPDPKE